MFYRLHWALCLGVFCTAAQALSLGIPKTLIDGTALYHVPDMVGKHLESIELQENSFKLVF